MDAIKKWTGELIAFSEKQNLNNLKCMKLHWFILAEWELLGFTEDCNKLGTILHYASQKVVFCENSFKNWPY